MQSVCADQKRSKYYSFQMKSTFVVFSIMGFHIKYICIWCMYSLCLDLYDFVILILYNVDTNYGLYVYVLYIMHASMILYILICSECVKGLILFLAMYVVTVTHPSISIELFLDVLMKKSTSITIETWF